MIPYPLFTSRLIQQRSFIQRSFRMKENTDDLREEIEKIRQESEAKISILQDKLRMQKAQIDYSIKDGDEVYCISPELDVVAFDFDEDDKSDMKILSIGNCFKTRERAEQVANKIKFLLRLEFLHDKYCPGFLNEQDYKKSFSIFRDSEEQEYQVFKSVGVYFGDEEVIKKVEEELKNNPQL